MDLMELIGSLYAFSSKTSLMAFVSTTSSDIVDIP